MTESEKVQKMREILQVFGQTVNHTFPEAQSALISLSIIHKNGALSTNFLLDPRANLGTAAVMTLALNGAISKAFPGELPDSILDQ